MKHWTLPIVSLAVLLCAGSSLNAQQEEQGPRGGGPEGRGPQEKVLHGQRPGRRMGEHQDMRGKPRHAPGEMLSHMLANPQMAERLGLSEEQSQTIRTAMEKTRGEMTELRTQLHEAAMEQGRILMEKDTDEAALMALIEKSGKIRTEIAKLAVRPLLVIKQTLTPEQMKQAHGLMKDRWKLRAAEGKREGKERGHRRGPPKQREKPQRPPTPEQPGEEHLL